MNIEKFKEKLGQYRVGLLSEEEELSFENELEKLDAYQAFLESEMDEPEQDSVAEDIVRKSQFTSYFRIGLVASIISLLLLPTLHVLGMAFHLFD